MNISDIISELPTGSQTRLAEQFGVSRQAISKALNGQMKGAAADRVIEAAKQLVELARHRRAAFELRQKISRMTDDELLKWAKRLE